MDLYFLPLACSLATRIIVNEIGADCDYRQVDSATKRTTDGEDFLKVNPLGYVPVLRTDDGRLITENTAVLHYVARLKPAAGLAPTEEPDASALQEWLGFISTELHKGIFSPLFSRDAAEAVKAYALGKARSRFDHVNIRLKSRATLLDRFTIADAYLFTVLNWTQATPLKLADWPELVRYHRATAERPSVARALAAELPLYRA